MVLPCSSRFEANVSAASHSPRLRPVHTTIVDFLVTQRSSTYGVFHQSCKWLEVYVRDNLEKNELRIRLAIFVSRRDTARIGNLQWRDFLPHLKGFVDTMGHNALRALDPFQSIRSFIWTCSFVPHKCQVTRLRFRVEVVRPYDPMPYNGSLECFPSRVAARGEKTWLIQAFRIHAWSRRICYETAKEH